MKIELVVNDTAEQPSLEGNGKPLLLHYLQINFRHLKTNTSARRQVQVKMLVDFR